MYNKELDVLTLISPSSEWPNSVIRALKAINSSYRSPNFNITTLRKTSFITDKNFSAKFKFYVGFTPKSYLLYCRVRHAKKLIKNSNATISHIAFDVGFETVSALNYSFKKIIGVTPTNYRMCDKLDE